MDISSLSNFEFIVKENCKVENYMTIREKAEQWCVSPRRM